MTHAIINTPRAIWPQDYSFIQRILQRETEGKPSLLTQQTHGGGEILMCPFLIQ